MMFAAADPSTPDPNSFLQFWVIIGFLATVAANVITVLMLISNRKQKREVDFAFVPASKEEFDRHLVDDKSTHAEIFTKLGGMERGLRAEFRADAEKAVIAGAEREQRINDHIESVRRELSSKLDNVAPQIIATLRQTKGLL